MMKRIITLVAISIMITLTLTSCGSQKVVTQPIEEKSNLEPVVQNINVVKPVVDEPKETVKPTVTPEPTVEPTSTPKPTEQPKVDENQEKENTVETIKSTQKPTVKPQPTEKPEPTKAPTPKPEPTVKPEQKTNYTTQYVNIPETIISSVKEIRMGETVLTNQGEAVAAVLKSKQPNVEVVYSDGIVKTERLTKLIVAQFKSEANVNRMIPLSKLQPWFKFEVGPVNTIVNSKYVGDFLISFSSELISVENGVYYISVDQISIIFGLALS